MAIRMTEQEKADQQARRELAKVNAEKLAIKQQQLLANGNNYKTISSKNLDMMLAAMTEGMQEHIQVMPERLFVGYFLPMFRNEISQEEAHERMGHWVKGAGGAMMPVNVKDDSGKIIFQVPAVWGTEHINKSRANGGSSIAQLLERVSLMFNYSSAQGEAMIKNSMAKRLAEMHDGSGSEQLNKKRDQWFAILKRYPSSSKNEEQSQQTEPETQAQDTFDDFVGEA